MKASLMCLILAGAALSSPVSHEKRQDIDFLAYDAVPYAQDVAAPVGDSAPQTASYDPTSVASAIVAAITAGPSSDSDVILKRLPAAAPAVTSCTTRTANGPTVTGDAAAFQGFSPFAAAASAATSAAAVPSGYAVVPNFVNLKATVQDSHYLTYTTTGITSYDPKICGAKCDAMRGCMAFNIYYERVPAVISTITQVPDPNICPAAVDSPSRTLLKCAFYGAPLSVSMAKNVGQLQGQLRVVIAGSNAYQKTNAPTLDGYTGPVSFGDKAINAPAPVIENGFLRSQTFGQGQVFDPKLCDISCKKQTEYNALHPEAGGAANGPCVFFNAYFVYKNGQNPVFTCVYYSKAYGIARATNPGQYGPAPANDYYSIQNSYGYYVNGYYVT